jgi:predicted ester cyclase
MSEENKALECRFIEEVFNEGYLATIDEPIDPDWVNQVDPVAPKRHAASRGLGNSSRCTTAPSLDMHITVEDQIAEGDKVVTRWTARGTHQGELIDIPPSSDLVTTKAITTDLFSEGKVVETWDSYDVLVMMQLGRRHPLSEQTQL